MTDDKARCLDYYPPRLRSTPVTQDMTHTYDKPAIARSVARMLLEIEAVLFRADDPFTLTSGMKSPVYIDCRKIIAFPRMRAQMMDYGRTVIMNDIGYESLDAVAGGETAGIPFAAWLAERTGLPMHYVRKKPKGFGRDAQIEGYLKEGSRVLLVEDLITDGGSKVRFVEALREHGVDPSRIEVEITESVLLADTEANLSVLRSLRDIGLKVSLDDFGTGYSSFSYLRKFAFDKLKIDRSFVEPLDREPQSISIVGSINALARALQMTTVAEGVETERQFEAVRIIGCDQAQGYLDAGDYYWNSGMFMFKASRYLEELEKYNPEIVINFGSVGSLK